MESTIQGRPESERCSVHFLGDLLEAIEFTRAVYEKDPMVIGGAEVYRQALPLATHLILTEVAVDVPEQNGDALWPIVGWPWEWEAERIEHWSQPPAPGQPDLAISWWRRR